MSNSQIGMLIYIAQLKYGGTSLLTLNDRTWLYIICLLDVWYLCDLQIFDASRCKDAAAAEKWRMKCKKPWAEFANIKPENILRFFQKHIGYIYNHIHCWWYFLAFYPDITRHVDIGSAQHSKKTSEACQVMRHQPMGISWQIHRDSYVLLFDVWVNYGKVKFTRILLVHIKNMSNRHFRQRRAERCCRRFAHPCRMPQDW